ncbi:MAG: transposase [Caldilineaceae bacterium SB0665_bin_21]|nr:transposase [Caldilineaceae bacterium SB0665_bin_21]
MTIRATCPWTSGGSAAATRRMPAPTDSEARLLRKGQDQEVRPAFPGPALRENHHGLLMDFTVSHATGTAKRDAVPDLLDGLWVQGYRPRMLGADRGYDTKDCVRATGTLPVARKKQHSAIDSRMTRHAGYAVNLRLRKRVEEVFGWMKTVGSCRHTRYRGEDRTGLTGYLVATAYHLVRMAKFLPEPETVTGPPGWATEGSAHPPRMPRGLRGPRNPRGAPHRQFQGPAEPPKLRFRTPLGLLMASKTYSSAAC